MKSLPFSSSAGNWPIISLLMFLGCLVTGLSALAGYYQGDLHHYFNEGGVTDWLSALQLLTVAVIAGAVYHLRRQQQTTWRSPQLLWLLVTIGFIFLTADELTQIHESMDSWIHSIWQLQETGLTDRIDDALVGLYGVVAAVILYGFRHELKRYHELRQLIVYSFGVLCLMVMFDLLTNRPDILPMLFGQVGYGLLDGLAIAEELCKLTIEAIVIGILYRVFWIEKQTIRSKAADPSVSN
ncbi:MAG: hypothetical protein F6K11_10495 [Leptolyngbya sp. SIO3F4]|nr:hypothetical protein [Leptolyngbya sp. SIO3F4]